MPHPYGDKVMEHFKQPRNQRVLLNATIAEEGVNPLCGDRVKVQVRLQAGMVVEAGFTANACAVCVASASVLTDLIQRAPLDEVETLTTDDVMRVLEATLPKGRLQCVALPLTVLHTGVKLYREAGGQ